MMPQPLSGNQMLALQQAVHDEFTQSDWENLGYQANAHEYISGHSRLLRSLYFGDEDYGSCIYQALRYFQANNYAAISSMLTNTRIRSHIMREAPAAALEFGLTSAHVPSPSTALTATQVVERALADADRLLHTSGPISCIDRLHTALHGYIKEVCVKANIPTDSGASLTQLFKNLRSDHPKFQHLGPQDKDIVRILNSLATIIDALNTLRNHASVAHPNQNLLHESEAMLAVNVSRSLFHYISSKT